MPRRAYIGLLCCLLLAACSKSDGYRYPIVYEEFFVARTDAAGAISSIVTDAGVEYPAVEDKSALHLPPDTLCRLVGYYEPAGGGVRVHSAIEALSGEPAPLLQYADSFPCAPVALQSAWASGGWLNVILNVKMAGGRHRIAFVDGGATPVDEAGCREVSVRVFHNEHGDDRAYTKRAYCSVPLSGYLSPQVRRLTMRLHWLDYSGADAAYTIEYSPHK